MQAKRRPSADLSGGAYHADCRFCHSFSCCVRVLGRFRGFRSRSNSNRDRARHGDRLFRRRDSGRRVDVDQRGPEPALDRRVQRRRRVCLPADSAGQLQPRSGGRGLQALRAPAVHPAGRSGRGDRCPAGDRRHHRGRGNLGGSPLARDGDIRLGRGGQLAHRRVPAAERPQRSAVDRPYARRQHHAQLPQLDQRQRLDFRGRVFGQRRPQRGQLDHARRIVARGDGLQPAFVHSVARHAAGIQSANERLFRPVRAHRRSGRQYGHALGRERVPRRALRVPAQRQAAGQQLVRERQRRRPRAVPLQPIRRNPRRSPVSFAQQALFLPERGIPPASQPGVGYAIGADAADEAGRLPRGQPHHLRSAYAQGERHQGSVSQRLRARGPTQPAGAESAVVLPRTDRLGHPQQLLLAAWGRARARGTRPRRSTTA